MGDYFHDAYNMRLNRYGNDYQSRILGQRQKNFQNLLLKSPNRVDFEFDGELVAGVLESYKQDETKTLCYLLTEDTVYIPNGTILEILYISYDSDYWMIYWNEDGTDTGYNKYVLLRMSHVITWTNRDGDTCTARGYFYGQEDNMLKDEIQSRSREHTLYQEALKTSTFITPFNKDIRKNDYFEITIVSEDEEQELTEAYVVTGYDIISTKGVEYVTVDPVYIRDNTPAPEQKSTDDPADFYWLNGGGTNE